MAVMDVTLPKARFAPRWDKSKGILGWVTTVDHKKIAIMYLFTTFFFFLVGGIMALLIRIQLAEPQNTFLSPEQYNQVFTMHGTTMILLWLIPVWAVFGNYFVSTIHNMRAPGMTWGRLPLFVWAQEITQALVVLASPFIAGALAMVLLDRQIGTSFFLVPTGGNALLYQLLFWFYSHPAVYIM